MIRTAWILCSAFVLLVAASPIRADLPPQTRWADPSSVLLDIEFPGNGYHATWEMHRCACGDLLIRSELSVPGVVEKGETLLVGGRAVLSRGFGEGDEELLGASMEAPALMMQLVLTLLERIAPRGPSDSYNGQAFSHLEELNPIYLDSGGAEGTFFAPWKVTATVQEKSPTERAFDMTYQFSTGNPGEELIASMRLWGTAEYAARPFPVPDEEALAGWTLDWRNEADPVSQSTDEITTLAELRAALKSAR